MLPDTRERPLVYLSEALRSSTALRHCPFCLLSDRNYNYVLVLHIVMEMMRGPNEKPTSYRGNTDLRSSLRN